MGEKRELKRPGAANDVDNDDIKKKAKISVEDRLGMTVFVFFSLCLLLSLSVFFSLSLSLSVCLSFIGELEHVLFQKCKCIVDTIIYIL